MTELDYQFLMSERPELNFPAWYALSPYSQDIVKRVDREELIARRTAVILRRDDVRGDEIGSAFDPMTLQQTFP